MSHSKEFFKLKFGASALRQGPSAFNSTLPLETSVLETLYGDQFTQSIQLIKPNYIVYISHRRSTTVSLETCRLDFYLVIRMRLCDLDFLYKGKCIFFKRQFAARTSGETNFSVRIKLKGKIPVMVLTV